MAKKMSKLDLCWKNCMSMWAWIIEQRRKSRCKDVDILKRQWCRAHGFSNKLIENCFFCEYHKKTDGGDISIRGCGGCPAKKIDRNFHCEHPLIKYYNWNKHPAAFYNKLRALNRKRLKK